MEASARLARAAPGRRRRIPSFFHIAPDGVREPYSAADNAKIASALFRKHPSVRVSDVVLPCGKMLHFEVRLGSNATSPRMPAPPPSQMIQVNLATNNTRVVVQSVAAPPAQEPEPEAQTGGGSAAAAAGAASLLEGAVNTPALDGGWNELFCGSTETMMCSSADQHKILTVGGSSPTLVRTWLATDGTNTHVTTIRSGRQSATSLAIGTSTSGLEMLWVGQSDGRIAQVLVGAAGELRLRCEFVAHKSSVSALLVDAARGRLWSVAGSELCVWHIGSVHDAKPTRNTQVGAAFLEIEPVSTAKLGSDVTFLTACEPVQQIVGGGKDGAIYVWDSPTYSLLGRVSVSAIPSRVCLTCGLFVDFTKPPAQAGVRSGTPPRADVPGRAAPAPTTAKSAAALAGMLWIGSANGELTQWIVLPPAESDSGHLPQLKRSFTVGTRLDDGSGSDGSSITQIVHCSESSHCVGQEGVLYIATGGGQLVAYDHSKLKPSGGGSFAPGALRLCKAHEGAVLSLAVVACASPNPGGAPFPPRGGLPVKLVSMGGKSGIVRKWDALECVLHSVKPTAAQQQQASTGKSIDGKTGLYGGLAPDIWAGDPAAFGLGRRFSQGHPLLDIVPLKVPPASHKYPVRNNSELAEIYYVFENRSAEFCAGAGPSHVARL
jgi:hypothetical protein